MAKKNREKNKNDFICRNWSLLYYYKNKRNTPDKLKFKKYDPIIRKHVLYNEGKIK